VVWVVLSFFHFDQKLAKRHMGWRSLCSLNYELAKFARERINTIFTMNDVWVSYVFRLVGCH
jgi:hypothetical protein